MVSSRLHMALSSFSTSYLIPFSFKFVEENLSVMSVGFLLPSLDDAGKITAPHDLDDSSKLYWLSFVTQ